jgi:2-keto-4-pentenoate hydratase
MDALIDVQAVAAEAFAALDTGRQIEPFSSRLSSFSLDDAYRVTAAVRKMRKARGELPAARKIGFTNRTIWAEYNVYEPVWGMFTIARCITSRRSAITFPLVGLALGLSETGF